MGRVEAALGPIDILIANAGTSTPPTTIDAITNADWDRLVAVNLTAPFLLARRVLPGMRERGFGRIVFVSSVAAFTGQVLGREALGSGLVHAVETGIAALLVDDARELEPAAAAILAYLPGNGFDDPPIADADTCDRDCTTATATVPLSVMRMDPPRRRPGDP